MDKLLEASTAFPSVVLSILVGIVLLYWLFVILGALDIDLFSGDVDADSALDGIAGKAGALDGVAGKAGALDAVAGKAGALDAVAGKTGALDGVSDIADGGGADGDGGGDGFSILAGLGLRRVPITISGTFIIVTSWTICLLVMYYVGPHLPEGFPRWLFGLLVLLGAILVSLPITAVAITPLAPVFVTHHAKTRRHYIGATCTVTTGRVDHDFGQGSIEDGGDVLIISLRCDRQDNGISRRDKVLVIDYDDDRNAYLVEPMDSLLKTPEEEG